MSDLAAAGLAFRGLSEYVERRLGKAAIWFSLAVLAKETAILAPLALFGWELVSLFLEFFGRRDVLRDHSDFGWRSA